MRIRMLFLAGGLAVLALASAPAHANVLITVDKSTQQMSVVVDGALRWQWKVSTGRSGRDTPSGTFHAFRMEAEHYSKEFDEAPMPHSIFFTQYGHAIHGSLDARHLGLPASHGCIRLDQANATALFGLVRQQGVANTTVVVNGNAAIALARARAATPRPAEASARPVVAPAISAYREDASYQVSGNERSPQPSAAPVPPPGYPPFPRAWP
ncbi:MAG TPA: L,D-transpeptidase [Xanthobacteraceae bacterium]